MENILSKKHIKSTVMITAIAFFCMGAIWGGFIVHVIKSGMLSD